MFYCRKEHQIRTAWKFCNNKYIAGWSPAPAGVARWIRVLKIHCGVEQLVARWAHNPKVVRSSRAPATTSDSIFESLFLFLCFSSTFYIQKPIIKFISDILPISISGYYPIMNSPQKDILLNTGPGKSFIQKLLKLNLKPSGGKSS
jgi:hypothetical protein